MTNETRALVLTSLQDTMALGKVFADSGFFSDSRGAAQAVTKVIAGGELGIPPLASMTGIHVINGRIALSANVLASLVKRSGKYNYRVREMTDTLCKIEFFENNESVGVSEFGIADAKRAQTKNLDKFPRNMLFARAMSNGVRWYCPDVTNGPAYTPEELGASTDEEGNVIDAVVVAPQKQVEDKQRTAMIDRIDALTDQMVKYDGHDKELLSGFAKIDDMSNTELMEYGKKCKAHLDELKANDVPEETK